MAFKKDWIRNEKLHRRILEETRRRVLERAEQAGVARREQEEQAIEIDVLAEISDLPVEEVQKIAQEVRGEFEGAAKNTDSRRGASLLRMIMLVVPLLVIGLVVFNSLRKEAAGRATARSRREYAQLLGAVREGNEQMVTYLLDRGAPLELETFSSALMAAASADELPMVKLLLGRGADVAWTDRGGQTALTYADRSAGIPMVNFLAQALADASPAGSPIRELWAREIPFTTSAFIASAAKNDVAAVKLFLAGEIDINAEGPKRKTALREAAGRGHHEVVRLLLAQTEPISYVQPPLQTATYRGHLEVVKAMIRGGVDPDGFPETWNALLYSLRQPAIRLFLVENGANLDHPQDQNGHTVLQIATTARLSNPFSGVTIEERREWVRFLLDRGADVNKRSAGGLRALDFARKLSDRKIMQWLEESGDVWKESQ